MIAPRWRKVFRDLLGRPGRSLLAVLAMAAGVFQIGAMLYKYALLQPELTTMYDRTQPAAATLTTDDASDALLESVRQVRGVAAAEARPVVITRLRLGEDEWVPAILFVVRDFEHQHIDTFEPEQGAWPPGDGEVLLERTALSVAGVAVNDSVTVRLQGEDDRVLAVSGTVHASGLAPAWMEHMVSGFVGWNSLVRGSEHGESAQIRIRVADHPLDEGYIREVADSVKAMLERQGHPVTRVVVPPPGRHPHADQMEAFLFLLLAFGILSFLLSTLLVAGMIHALMAEQVQQMGVMKAIGATSRQVAGIYLGQVAILSLLALAIGIPLGIWVGGAYAQFAAGILNADITHRPFPWWLIGAEVVVGVVVPLLVALVPIRRATRITVRQALSDDPDDTRRGTRHLDRFFARNAWLPRPLALWLRSTLARRGRLALAVGTLAVGGAVFVSALNVSAAWTRSVDADFRARRYDLAAGLAGEYPIDTLASVLASVPAVEHAEYWPSASPYLIGPSGVPTVTVSLVGPDSGSRLLALPLLAGRWLGPDDRDGVVVNRIVTVRNPRVRVGGTVQIRIEGRTLTFPVVGMTKELAPMPVIYAPASAVRAATGRRASMASNVRIVTRGHDDAAQRAAARAVERAFEERGIEVRGMQRMLDLKKGILDHLVIIMAILTMASVIVVIVGGIGLTSTLTLNVIQRTREIGILGAIGATPRTLSRLVWSEGVFIALVSWCFAMVLSAPISYALEAACGNIFFKAPLDFYMSPGAAALWLALVIVLATVSSLYPARRATRLTVREALSCT